MEVEVLFGIHILLHILVHIQMVGRHIGDEGGIRAAAHRDELEAGELHHGGVLRLDLVDDGQQRRTDVAAQMHRSARPAEGSAMRVVLVVLPSEPVMPYTGQGQSARNSSSSLVTATPRRRASVSSGV